MTTYRLTCCRDAVSVGALSVASLLDEPSLCLWWLVHGEHPMQAERLRPEPLPKRAPGRKKPAVAHALQPELFGLPRREPGAGGE